MGHMPLSFSVTAGLDFVLDAVFLELNLSFCGQPIVTCTT